MNGDAKDPSKAMPVLPSGKGTNEIVQSTDKFWSQPTILICGMRTHVAHLVQLLHGLPTSGNLTAVDPLPSV
jgi:hypothetical protein